MEAKVLVSVPRQAVKIFFMGGDLREMRGRLGKHVADREHVAWRAAIAGDHVGHQARHDIHVVARREGGAEAHHDQAAARAR